jgi:hypothetical protein
MRAKGSVTMNRGNTRRRLLWPVVVAALAASAVGLLWTADRSALAVAANPAGARPGAVAPSPDLPESFGGVQILAPQSGAKLRGLARVAAEWPNARGYAVFRVDGKFMYATTPPYEMRWDTSTGKDGKHVVTVDAYDSSTRYAGSASIGVVVENSIDSPPEGVLLTVRFDERDQLGLQVSARGELEALRANEVLPAGFDVLSGELRGRLSQSVLDTLYEGTSALVRNQLRTGSLIIGGTSRPVSEAGRYAMVQISPNGLAVPETAGGTRPRLGIGEVSISLADYPVVPGDTWHKPMGVVCDLYTRRAIYVQGTHTFEGLRWFRGRECAVITSKYTIPELPLFSGDVQQVAATLPPSPSYTVELTQMRGGGRRGGGMRGGMMGGGMRGGGMRGGMMGGGMRGGASAQRRGPATAGAGGAPGRAAGELQRVRLVDLEGTRRTFLTREGGRILHMQDTILGSVQFQVASTRVASAERPGGYTLELAQMRGGGMRGGGMRGGMMGGGMRGGGMRAGGTSRQAGGAAAVRPGAQAGPQIPPKLRYGFELAVDLVESD